MIRFGFRELVFFLVLLSVPVAAWYFVFRPRNVEIELARQEISDKMIKLERLRQLESTIESLDEAIRTGQSAIQAVEAKLPSEQNIEEVVSKIAKTAKSHQLTILAMTTDDKIPAAQYMELPINIEIVGGFDGFYQFLLELERFERLTRIHNLTMERQDDATGELAAAFDLSIYFESPESMASAAEGR